MLGRITVCLALGAVAIACSSAPPTDPPEDLTIPDRDPPKKETNETEPEAPSTIPGEPIAPACTDACETESERRCHAGTPSSFESCLRNAKGCLEWVESACASGATCEPAAPEACFGQCPPAGKEACTQIDAKRCTGTSLETCSLEGGCLVWKQDKDCAATNQICDGSACVTQCTSNCTTPNARRCVSGTNNYETCKEVQPGCLKWQSATSCGSSKVCTGAGVCACNDQCTTVGSNACVSPDTYKKCTTNAAGCKVWTAAKSCERSTPSPGCYAYPKACFGTCNDTCTTEGQITCTGSTSYVKCVRNAEQCLTTTSGTCKTSTACFSNPSLCANGN